jgi:hypothetical protein
MTAHLPDPQADLAAAERPRFVAYVYPGWHPDEYRAGVNEWDLLDHFDPRFEGHPPPLQPSAGRYDDSRPEAVARQMSEAATHGIEAFSYFTYYSGDGPLLHKGVNAAFDLPLSERPLSLCTTWCIRLPHNGFPVPHGEHIEAPIGDHGCTDSLGGIMNRRLEDMTLRDVVELMTSSSEDGLMSRVSLAIRTVLESPDYSDIHALLALARHFADPLMSDDALRELAGFANLAAAASLRDLMDRLPEHGDRLASIRLKDLDALVRAAH